MQFHQLKPTKRKEKKKIGRGGTHGTTATRGTKGQKARSGSYKGPSFEGTKVPLFRRTPKMRGFKSIYKKNNAVNLSVLENNFQNGDVITARALLNKDLVNRIKPNVKILGDGELKKKIIIEGCLVSKSAEEKIKKAGGEVRII